MPTVEFMGKEFTVDEDGFIDSYENWSDEWVQWVKKELLGARELRLIVPCALPSLAGSVVASP